MSLNKAKLGDDLLAMMNSAKDQGWNPEQVADAMAAAIDSYVRGGDVTGVTARMPNGEHAVQEGAVKLS